MSRFSAFAVVALTMMPLASAAEEDVMASRYGNTTVSTNAKGEVTKAYYNADHTMTSVIGGKTFKATWTLKDGIVCRIYEHPLPSMTNPDCRPVQPRKVGESWSVGSGADKMDLKLVPGIQ